MRNLQHLANQGIERLRKIKKLSREEMAHQLDISVEAYRKIENGTTKLSLDRLSQICDILETDIMHILNPEIINYNINEVKDKAIGVNKINHVQDKPIEERLSQLEESVRLLTILVHKQLGEPKSQPSPNRR